MNDTELSKSANSGSGAECLRSRLRSRAPASCRCRLRSRAPASCRCRLRSRAPASCRCRLRSRAVKRAYFTLISTAMHAHPVRRRTAPVSYVRRHAPCGALYGYYIKTFRFIFLSKFAAPNAKFMLCRVNKVTVCNQSGTE